MRRGRRKFDDDDSVDLDQFSPRRGRPEPPRPEDSDRPETGDAWSTWDAAEHGPAPRPEWVRTESGAVDTELGLLKTGKEADVFLVRRALPETDQPATDQPRTGRVDAGRVDAGQVSMLAAKRYRDGDHRLFHRDAGYLDGRRVRRSREMRAMTNRTSFGKELIAGQWAAAEFGALSHLWQVGQESGLIRVPYPVQLRGTELMLEFIGDWDTGEAAPRLAQVRAGTADLADLWRQMTDALSVLARTQVAHGDLSPYNTLVHEGRLILIDLPQIIDVVANSQGAGFIARDVRNVAAWFIARGLRIDVDALIERLLYEAGLK
jgi:RIO kinase 1